MIYKGLWQTNDGNKFENHKYSTKNRKKPLIIMGPTCSGKSTLIDHLIHGKPKHFVQAIPYTDRKVFRKEEVEDFDYYKPPEGFKGNFFASNEVGTTPDWLFNFRTEFINPMAFTNRFGPKS